MMLQKQPKPKKCKWSKCGKVFTPLRPLQMVCNYVCASGYTQERQKIKEAAKVQKVESIEEINQRVKQIKESLKKLSEFESEAKKVFQLWVRIRDKDRECISCKTKDSEIWDGGHWNKAELFSGLIFHEMNCHKQCRKCNYYLNGNEAAYREGLINRYGLDYVTQIESIRDSKRQYSWTREELVKIKLKYKQKIKELKTSAP